MYICTFVGNICKTNQATKELKIKRVRRVNRTQGRGNCVLCTVSCFMSTRLFIFCNFADFGTRELPTRCGMKSYMTHPETSQTKWNVNCILNSILSFENFLWNAGQPVRQKFLLNGIIAFFICRLTAKCKRQPGNVKYFVVRHKVAIQTTESTNCLSSTLTVFKLFSFKFKQQTKAKFVMNIIV